jgi:hypothetical protein
MLEGGPHGRAQMTAGYARKEEGAFGWMRLLMQVLFCTNL